MHGFTIYDSDNPDCAKAVHIKRFYNNNNTLACIEKSYNNNSIREYMFNNKPGKERIISVKVKNNKAFNENREISIDEQTQFVAYIGEDYHQFLEDQQALYAKYGINNIQFISGNELLDRSNNIQIDNFESGIKIDNNDKTKLEIFIIDHGDEKKIESIDIKGISEQIVKRIVDSVEDDDLK